MATVPGKTRAAMPGTRTLSPPVSDPDLLRLRTQTRRILPESHRKLYMGGGGQDSGIGQERRVLQVFGSQFEPLYFPGVLQFDQAQAVVLRAGKEMQADLAMRRIKLVEVAGLVMGVDGAPEVRAYVHLSAAGVQDWFTGLGTSADSKGD